MSMTSTSTKRRRTHHAPKNQPTVFIDFDTTGEFDAFVARLRRAFSPRILGELIRRAAAETILLAIRKRFIEELPNALEMVVVHNTMGELQNLRARSTDEMARWSKLQEELNAAHLSGDVAAVGAVQKRVMQFRRTLLNSLNRDRKGKEHTPNWSSLSSGRFRARALDVIDKMTAMSSVQVTPADGGNLTVSFGSVDELNAIKTPSAVQYVFHRGATRSPYNILWRHLEFGTGFYSKDPEGANHPNAPRSTSSHETFREEAALGQGYWRFPTGKADNPYARSIVLKGSKGVHALKDASGVMYEADARQFQAVLGLAIWHAISDGGDAQ